MSEGTMDAAAMWVGYSVMLAGGLGGAAYVVWWAFDTIHTRLGWYRRFRRYTRHIIAAERAERGLPNA